MIVIIPIRNVLSLILATCNGHYGVRVSTPARGSPCARTPAQDTLQACLRRGSLRIHACDGIPANTPARSCMCMEDLQTRLQLDAMRGHSCAGMPASTPAQSSLRRISCWHAGAMIPCTHTHVYCNNGRGGNGNNYGKRNMKTIIVTVRTKMGGSYVVTEWHTCGSEVMMQRPRAFVTSMRHGVKSCSGVSTGILRGRLRISIVSDYGNASSTAAFNNNSFSCATMSM